MGWTIALIVALVVTLGMVTRDGRRSADPLIGKR